MSDQKRNTVREAESLFMYHCFPRRRAVNDDGTKGLSILELIAHYGLLLTPEIVRWKDKKTPPSPPEEYIQVSRRCCFTLLPRSELEKHAEFFGPYILEFDCRTLCDLGAMPVFYIPRMSEYEDYGVGPAIVTQLAHVQDILSRIAVLRRLAKNSAALNPSLPIVGMLKDDNFILQVVGTTLACTIPKGIIDRAKQSRPEFKLPEIPPDGASIGFNSGGLSNLFNFLTWGIHEPDVLVGVIKALGSLFYPTERRQDPLLSYYQQREWRLIGGLLHETVPVMETLSLELRRRLLELDTEYFGRQLDFPDGRKSLVDGCEVFSKKHTGEHVLSLSRRVICPNNKVKEVRALLGNFANIEVISHDDHFGRPNR